MRHVKTAVVALLLACATVGSAQTPVRPDFSGTWAFDADRSMAPGPNGRIVIAKMLGDQVTVAQDAITLKLTITIGGEEVRAAYKLDGSATTNVSSEGGQDVAIVSRATWEDRKLVITSTSTSDVKGKPVTIETKRVLWIDEKGGLILDRSGTPVSEVTPSRSVYKKVGR